MADRKNLIAGVVSCLFVLALTPACDLDLSDVGEQDFSVTDPEALEASLDEWFVPTVYSVVDGFFRLASALDGGPLDGVTITNASGNSAQGQLSIDTDFDGTRETTVSGSVTGSIDTGAVVNINNVSGSDGLSLNASSSVTPTSPTTVLFSSMQASVSGELDSGDMAQATVSSGTVSLDLVSGTPSGNVALEVSDGNESLPLTLSFQPNGTGGWQVNVSGDGVDFTLD